MKNIPRFLRCLVTGIAAAVLIAGGLFAETPEEMKLRAQQLEKSGVLMEATSVYSQYLRQRPGDTRARMAQVGLLLKLNRTGQALPHIDRLKRDLPNDPQVRKYVELARQYRQEQVQRRIREYERRLKQTDDSPEVILEYARFLGANNYNESALKQYKRYLEAKPEDGDVRYEYAQNLAWNQKYNLALLELDKYLRLNPRSVRANLLAGDIHYWNDRKEAALNAYNRAREIDPKNRTAKRKIDLIVSTPGYREAKLKEALEHNPTGPALTELARIYLDAGREWEADSLVNLRLEAAPDDTVARNLVREIESRKRQRYLEQIEAFEEQMAVDSTDTTAILGLARYYTSLPNFEESLNYYDLYLEMYPLDYQVRLERAMTLAWAGRAEEAAEEFRQIYFTMPENREAKLGLAEALLASDTNLEEAEEIFREELEDSPDSLRAKIGLAEALRRQGEYEDAREIYDQVLEVDSTNSRALQGLTWLEKDLGPLIRRLTEDLQENPDGDIARRKLAGLLFDAKRYWEAESHVRYLLEKDPDNIQLKSYLAEIERHKKTQLELKELNLKRHVSENPEDNKARIEYADILAAAKKFEQAAAQYRLVMEKTGRDEEVLWKLADVYAEDRKFNQAVEILERLADENPRNFDYRFRLAQILSWMGEYERALFAYRKALELDPKSMECRLAIAKIHPWQDNPYRALEEYKDILALDPDNREAHKQMKELNRIFLRGIKGVASQSWDSEEYLMQKYFTGMIINLSLQMQAEAGVGRIYLEQDDPTRRYTFSELGWFLYAVLDYRFDPLTSARAQARSYYFEERNPWGLRLEITHDFQDTEELKGFTGTVYFESKEAVFHLASTHSLMTWTLALRSERFGLHANYLGIERWVVEGDVSYTGISDGNSRTDFYAEARYILKKYLQVGLRYDYVSADKQELAYWSPELYHSLVGVALLENSFNRWGYSLRGTYGRVIETGDPTKTLSAGLNYKLGKVLYLGGNYFFLNTTRYDGKYEYSGVLGSVTWNW